jgi:DNA polymerase III sliding clamp (beta) subunit (PCNA family)
MNAIAVIPKPPPKKAKIDTQDAIPRAEVEVVSKIEAKHSEQLKKKAKAPARSFTAPTVLSNREVFGAEVDAEALFGFLSAAAEITEKKGPLSNIKLAYQPGADKAFLEAAGFDIWTVVAMAATPKGAQGFELLVPVRQARNAANLTRDDFKRAQLGFDADGFWLGQHCLQPGGEVADFPSRPVLRQYEARAAIPAWYCGEVCNRVLGAMSRDPSKPQLDGVLLEFDEYSCTAIATDGYRLHMLRLPQMKIDPRGKRKPPSVFVRDSFFRWLRAVANREWTAIEISDSQISGRGEDYYAVSRALPKGEAGPISGWEKAAPTYPGWLTLDAKEFDRVLSLANKQGSDVDLEYGGLDKLAVIFHDSDKHPVRNEIGARRSGGPTKISVRLDPQYLLDAVRGTKSGLIRLGAPSKVSEQEFHAVTIQGDDDLFKAVVMPKRR